MSLLILPAARTRTRRQAHSLVEEPHFNARVVRRAVAAIDKEARRGPRMGLSVRSDLPGLKVADVRRALAGLPSPGDYQGVTRPMRSRNRRPSGGLCQF